MRQSCLIGLGCCPVLGSDDHKVCLAGCYFQTLIYKPVEQTKRGRRNRHRLSFIVPAGLQAPIVQSDVNKSGQRCLFVSGGCFYLLNWSDNRVSLSSLSCFILPAMEKNEKKNENNDSKEYGYTQERGLGKRKYAGIFAKTFEIMK